jgi:hypothetical protein
MSKAKWLALRARIGRFTRKPLSEKLASIVANLSGFGQPGSSVPRRRWRLLTGGHAPPLVFQANEQMYLAFRPDADAVFSHHPEIHLLSGKWVESNVANNAGDLPRLYALVLNAKQVLNEGIVGDLAELGVYRGNSAAVLAHYAREHGRALSLFDTFEGFDRRDLVGGDAAKHVEFDDTSVENVRELVGDRNVRFIPGRFPASIPTELTDSRFCLVHIDCDLYEPAKAGLEFFYPRLSPGGLMIVHDYANPYWGGMKQALDEFCTGIAERPIIFGDKSGTAMIRKAAEPSSGQSVRSLAR